ncbi:MAG: hypothetical protein SGI92_33185 [Bryobacteraceae bacterium]|nr:hypothetical protein [Bryobacteraceae bacterium]
MAGGSEQDADRAEHAALAEIDRLSKILSAWDASSELRALGRRGFVLIFLLAKKRTSGLLKAALGAMVCWAVYAQFVPQCQRDLVSRRARSSV